MRIILILLFLLITSALNAKITWETKAKTQEAGLFSSKLLYSFVGTNTGSEPIIINAVRSSCSCLVASVSETTVEPNASFLVAAEFDPNEVGGLQSQRIFLEIEEQERPEVLKLTADLPELISTSPMRLFWKSSSNPKSQNVKLILSKEVKVELRDVYAMDENFFTSLNRVSENTFLLEVTPRDTEVQRPAAVMVRFMAEGRILKITIPCVIAERNPFEIDFRPEPKGREVSFEQLKAEITEQNAARVQGLPEAQKPTFPRPLNSEK
jgi:hypothetical protein